MTGQSRNAGEFDGILREILACLFQNIGEQFLVLMFDPMLTLKLRSLDLSIAYFASSLCGIYALVSLFI